jgi:hypothetical protein
MKKEYLSPDLLVVKVETHRPMLDPSDGVYGDPNNDVYEGKQHGDVVEEDGEETSLFEKEAQPLAFSNNYLKKVWD